MFKIGVCDNTIVVERETRSKPGVNKHVIEVINHAAQSEKLRAHT